MAKIANDFLERLAENKKLYENPGWGKHAETASSFIGLHGFWVLLAVSLVSALVFLSLDTHWWANDVLFGWMY